MDGKDYVRYEDVGKFVKTNAFMNEVFRLYNPAFGLAPRIAKLNSQFIGDIEVKKGL